MKATTAVPFALLLAIAPLTSSPGLEVTVSTVADLKQALLNASLNNEDDIINLAPGTYDVSAGGLRWRPGWSYEPGWPFGQDKHALTIQGAGAAQTVLDGGGITRILYANTQNLQSYHPEADRLAHLTLRGMTFQNGNGMAGDVTSGGGVAALVHWASITVAECAFTNNLAAGGSGLSVGISYETGTATVSDCRFENNSAGGVTLGGNGSVIFQRNRLAGNSGAAAAQLDCSRGTLTASDNVLTGNRAGGFSVNAGYYTGVTVTIANNVVQGCASGGGLWIALQTDAVLNLTNNTISGNRAGSGGGVTVWAKMGGGSEVPADVCPALNLYNNILWGNSTTYPGLFWDDLRITRELNSPINLYHNDIRVVNIDPWYDPAQAGGNLNADPLFLDGGHWDDGGTPADPADDTWVEGGYHLSPGSPCVDVGTNGAPGLPLYDSQGDDRVIDGNGDGTATVDIGADEVGEPGVQDIAVDPASHDFGEVVLGFSQGQEFVVSSLGTAALTITEVRVVGIGASQFELAGACPTVPPGGACTLQVTFVAAAPGTWSPQLEIDSGDPDTPTLTIPLVGTGRDPKAIRVDAAGGSDANDGSEWAQALQTIDVALSRAQAGDELWLKAGTYLLGFTSPGIALDKPVGVYGGFDGTEGTREERDWQAHETLVDANTWAKRCFHITASARLDGLTIARGNAPNYPTFPDNAGGGVYVSGAASPVIANCRIMENQADYGAGIYHEGAGLTVTDCVISGNYAHELGGGIYSAGPLTLCGTTISANDANGDGGGILNFAQLRITSSTISGNTAIDGGGIATRDYPGASLTLVGGSIAGNTASGSGGGISATGGAVKVINAVVAGNTALSYEGGGGWGGGEYTNCLFTENVASSFGGGLYSPGVSMAAVLTNCTLSGNHANVGGGVATGLGDRPVPPQVRNCILWGNTVGSSGPQVYPSSPVVQYSDVAQDGYAGSNGNIRSDPLFLDAAHGDYHLRGASPCLDAGNSAAVPADSADLDEDGDTTEPVPRDLAGNARCFDAPRADTGSGPPPVVDMGAYEYTGDDDEDGIADDEEMGPGGADPDYDGNADGLPDRLQANVASLTTADELDYATLAAPDGTVLSGVVAGPNPSPADAPPGIDFPFGFFRFTIRGVTPGAAVTATLYLPSGYALTSYHRHGPEPGNPTPHWYEFMYDGTTGAEIMGNVVTLHFVDGQRGDDDLAADGTVVDDGAPARLAAGLPADLRGRWTDIAVTVLRPPKRHRIYGILTIRNGGYTATSARSRAAVYLSADTALGPRDRRLCTIVLPRLAPGAAVTYTFRRNVSVVPSGLYLLAVIDVGNRIAEERESDNTVCGAIP